MILEWSCDAPRSCPKSKRSSPTTPVPARFAAQYTAPEPIPPSPTTATSKSLLPAISDLGFGVRVVLVGAHRSIRLTLPVALLSWERDWKSETDRAMSAYEYYAHTETEV